MGQGQDEEASEEEQEEATHPHCAAILPLVMLRSVLTTRTSLHGSSPSALTAASSSASPPDSDSDSKSSSLSSSALALLASVMPRCRSTVSRWTRWPSQK